MNVVVSEATVTQQELDENYPKSIECYVCNSEYDPRCGDPFDSYALGTVNCSLRKPLEHLPEKIPVLCRKTVQKIQGKIRIIRGCGYIPDERDNKECVKRSGTHEVNVQYCSCTQNLCNTGHINNIKKSTTSIITISLIGLLISFNRRLLLD